MISVLIVDDDEDLLEMVRVVLDSFNMKVSCIQHGAQLFDAISEQTPDLILMDIYLGQADGRHLCHSLKTSGEFSALPVILYSAGVISPGSIEESLADEFIPKPFDIAELVRRIEYHVA